MSEWNPNPPLDRLGAAVQDIREFASGLVTLRADVEALKQAQRATKDLKAMLPGLMASLVELERLRLEMTVAAKAVVHSQEYLEELETRMSALETRK